MLSQLRNSAKGWVAKLLLALLVVAFAVWGIGDIFRTQTDTTVAEVGDRTIESQAFLDEFSRIRERFGAQMGAPMPTEQALALGLDRIALNQLISRAVLEHETDRLGLAVSDEALLAEIQSFEAFQGPTGRFDATVYRQTLFSNQMTPQSFEAMMASDVVRMQLVDAVVDGIRLPQGLADWMVRLQGERRAVTYLTLPAEAVTDLPQPDDAALQALHVSEGARFTAPERRDFTYLMITPEDLVGEIAVAEERIRELYTFNEADYVTPERREIRQLTFQTREEAEAAAAEITDALSFTEAALARGFQADELSLGTITRDDMFDEAFAEAAFGMDSPGVTGLIEGDLGYAILAVDAIEPAKAVPFEEARDELRQQIALEEAQIAVTDLLERVEDARAGGSTLEEIGQSLALPVRSVEAVTAQGEVAGAETTATAPPFDVVSAAFASEPGLENDFEDLADGGYFVVRVDGVTPAFLRPLDEVRDEVVALWQDRERGMALTALGEAAAERARSGASFDTLATELGGKVVTPVDPIGRGSVDDALTADLVRELFRAETGGIVDGTGQGGRSYVIASVTDILPTDDSDVGVNAVMLQTELGRRLPEELSEQLVVALQDDIGVKVNDRAVAFALGQESGGAGAGF